MTDSARELNRRQALKVGGIIGTGALAMLLASCTNGSAAAAASPSDASTGLAGAWLEDVTLDDGSKHQTISLYTKDGGIASIPSFPSSEFSARFGAWTRSGDGYLMTSELFAFDSSGAVSSILRIRAQATIDQTGDHMSGEAHEDMQSAGHSAFVPVLSARFTASRIKPLAL